MSSQKPPVQGLNQVTPGDETILEQSAVSPEQQPSEQTLVPQSPPQSQETIVGSKGDTLPEVSEQNTADRVTMLEAVVDPGETATAPDPGDATIAPTPSAATGTPADSMVKTRQLSPEEVARHQAAEDPGATVVPGQLEAEPMNPGATIVRGPDLEDVVETLDGGLVNPERTFDRPDVRVIGDYEILTELGRGGMGVVYKARHRTLRRVVALKMILSGGHNTKESLQRFLSEARAVAHLQHQGIVQIFDIGEHEGLPFFSLEYVEGTDLQKDLDGRPCAPEHAAKMVESVCRAMHYAHENGILHRDLKPANLLLNKEGEAKITDFGLAKEVDAEGSGATNDGTIMGSPSYMPPEQARGELSSVSAKSDQYSLGAVLYQMLTARPPFLSDRPFDTVMQVINNDAVAPRELNAGIPEELETICMKALQKDQDARYDSCAQMADDLRRFINGEPILAKPVSRAERLWRWCKRNPRIAVPSGLAGVFITLTAVIATWAWQETSAQAQTIAAQRDEVTEQRDEANEQRDEADRQRGIAIAQQKQAEENEELARRQATLALQNIQYVITEVDTRLKTQTGVSDLRIAILEAASEKWNELDVEMTGGIRGEAIPTLMALRQQIAIAFSELDKLEDANTEFEKLFKLGQERIDLKGANDATRTNMAKISMAWAPVKRRLQSSPAEAMDLISSSIALVEDCLNDPQPQEDSPSQLEIRELLAALQQNLGVEFLNQGNLPATAANFEKALRNMAEVLDSIRSEPGFAELSEDQKDSRTAMKQLSHDKSALGLAYISMRLGETKRSIELYNAAVTGRREIYERRTGMAPLKAELAGTVGNYGQSLLWIRDLDGATPLLEESVTLYEELHTQDPQNAGHTRALSTAQYRLATLRDMQGDQVAESAGLFEASRSLRAELFSKSGDQKNQINLMLASARSGQVEEARKHIDELGASEGTDGELHLERARALAQLARHVDENAKAAVLDEAVAATQRAVDEGYQDPFRVNAEPDLESLRSREDFKAIVTNLQQQQ